MSREIMQQALNIIKDATQQIEAEWIYDYEDGREAIAALEAELAKPEQPDLRKAAEMALEVLERASDAGYSIECEEAITALRQALAPPEHPLDKKADNARELGLDYEPDMSTKQQNVNTSEERVHKSDKSIHEMQRLGQELGQEPVAWMHVQGYYEEPNLNDLSEDAIARGWEQYPLYTAPPKHEWVGLTDEEITEIRLSQERDDIRTSEMLRKVEAKLREKNG